jgi:hypothetical protein
MRMPQGHRNLLRKVARNQWLGVDIQKLNVEEGKAWTEYMFLYREELLARPNN